MQANFRQEEGSLNKSEEKGKTKNIFFLNEYKRRESRESNK